MFAYSVGHGEFGHSSRKQDMSPLFGRDTLDPWATPSTDSVVTLGSVYSTSTSTYDLKDIPTSSSLSTGQYPRQQTGFKASNPFSDTKQIAFNPEKFEEDFVFGESNSTLDLTLSFPGENDKRARGAESLGYTRGKYAKLEADRASVKSRAKGITRSMSRRLSLGAVMHRLRSTKSVKKLDYLRRNESESIVPIIE
ncbi:hypothetical protein TRVA0_001S02410 [Trichomonascus vanleenenianus]|uniref:uncharacterized protein n=1 Tax=Trichomonascus vanleenenianus TaxID=2268995 RepID=UPI003ECB7AF6